MRYYGDNDFKNYRGYRLSAIDGTVLELNNSERLRKAFGYVENDLILFDRGYPSSELIGYLENENIKYLMRVSKIFLPLLERYQDHDVNPCNAMKN